jgi:hypothetical protein
MKSKAILVSLLALCAIAFVMTTVNASDVIDIDNIIVKFNDMYLDPTGVTATGESVSSVVPVDVEFTALGDYKDVKVKVYIEGYKDEISESTDRFYILDGTMYKKSFKIELPSSTDLDDRVEDLTLIVRISAKSAMDEDGNEISGTIGSGEAEYKIRLQRNLYSLDVLAIDVQDAVVTWNVVAVDVVLENNGYDRLDNVFVKASMPDLGVSRNVFIGDMAAVDENNYDDIVNSISKRIYLNLPRNTAPGTYNLVIEASNNDVSVSKQQKVEITVPETSIVPPVTAKSVAPGEEVTFDVVLVNPSDKVVIFTLTPQESTGIVVTVQEPVVVIPAQSSKTVKVTAKAAANAAQGTHLVTINVNSETGAAKQVSFTVNVEGKNILSTGDNRSNTVLVLTIVLAIIFVVLLVILIVLLTKKPAESEELGETSYY